MVSHTRDLKEFNLKMMVSQGCKLIENARHSYFMKIGQTLSNADTGQKTHWSLINKVLNKAQVRVIAALLENDIFILDFKTKASIFNDYFILQCTTIDTGSEIPNIATSNAPALVNIHITEEKILKIIRSLNPNKAHGWDEISVRMIKISNDVLVASLKMVFESCIQNGIRYPFFQSSVKFLRK